jgi:hypothetical protein
LPEGYFAEPNARFGVEIDVAAFDETENASLNLHDELSERVAPQTPRLGNALYAVAYRVAERENRPHLDIWQEALTIGGPLPKLPLWLDYALCVPVDLAASYARTCVEQRIAA